MVDLGKVDAYDAADFERRSWLQNQFAGDCETMSMEVGALILNEVLRPGGRDRLFCTCTELLWSFERSQMTVMKTININSAGNFEEGSGP